MTPLLKFIIIMNIVSFLVFVIDRIYHDARDESLFPFWVYFLVTILFGSVGVNLYFLLFYAHFSLGGYKYREARGEKDYYLFWRIFAAVMFVIQVILYKWMRGNGGIIFFDRILAFLISNKVFLIYLLAINVATFVVFAIDKIRAINEDSRIRELVLLAFATAGGSVGALLAMVVCHHKIRKMTFAIGIPLIIVMQIVLVSYLLIGV